MHQLDDGALAAAAGSHQGDGLVGLDDEAEALQDPHVGSRRVVELNIAEDHKSKSFSQVEPFLAYKKSLLSNFFPPAGGGEGYPVDSLKF